MHCKAYRRKKKWFWNVLNWAGDRARDGRLVSQYRVTVSYHVLQSPYCVTVQVTVQGPRTVTVACSEVKCSEVQCSEVQCSAVQYHAVLVNSRSRLIVASLHDDVITTYQVDVIALVPSIYGLVIWALYGNNIRAIDAFKSQINFTAIGNMYTAGADGSEYDEVFDEVCVTPLFYLSRCPFHLSLDTSTSRATPTPLRHTFSLATTSLSLLICTGLHWNAPWCAALFCKADARFVLMTSLPSLAFQGPEC